MGDLIKGNFPTKQDDSDEWEYEEMELPWILHPIVGKVLFVTWILIMVRLFF